MPSKTVRRLFKKFADTSAQDRDEQFRLQRERLEQFYHDLHMKLKVLLNEMEGDISVLKERKFPHDLLKSFVKVWYQLIEINKSLKPNNPYTAAEELIKYVTQKPHRAIIDNLDFLVQNHMKKTEIDFQTGPLLRQAQVRSLVLLKELAHRIDQYIQDNPLMDVPVGVPPEDPKDLKVPPSKFEPEKVTEQETTYVPPVNR